MKIVTAIPKPRIRPRRLRRTESIRRMVRETVLNVDDLIYPVFITAENNVRREIPSMPGQYQLSLNYFVEEISEIRRLGIKAVILFGIPAEKDALGSDSFSENGIIQQAVRAAKKAEPEILIITDVCLCEYTDHGHCGPIKEGTVDNDATLELLAKQVISHAHAGADMVAPSGMMDGMVRAIRTALDSESFQDVGILSYAVKYASAFYGPFRDAADSAPQFGDRRSYQMDPANSREALRETFLDVEEGADILMVKPALAYLDIIHKVKAKTNLPLAAYNVSGEYSMVKAAAKNGWIDEEKLMMEILTGIKRAGADLILTYFAKDVAKLLRKNK